MWYILNTGLCFRVIRCALHLDLLNIRPAENDQVARLLRSSCNIAASVGDFMDLKILVSSAKAETWLDFTAPEREFAYRRNRMGPNMDPEGLLMSLEEPASSLRVLLPSASDRGVRTPARPEAFR